MLRTLPLAAALLLPAAHPPAPDLAATLARLDAASARFQGAEAHVRREAYTSLIKDTATTEGSLYVLRTRDGKTQVGIRTTGEGARTIEYKNGVIRDYIAASNCYNTVNKPGIDAYLSLGFGGSGKDLESSWTITDEGNDAALKAEKLDLVPKDPSVKSNITHVTIWIDLDQDVTRKLIFYAPTGDTNTAIYSDIQLRKSIKTDAYAIKGKPCS